jgi:hypothetical protein
MLVNSANKLVEIHYMTEWKLKYFDRREEIETYLNVDFFQDHEGGVHGIEIEDGFFVTIFCKMDCRDVPSLKELLDSHEILGDYVTIEFQQCSILWKGIEVDDKWIIRRDAYMTREPESDPEPESDQTDH